MKRLYYFSLTVIEYTTVFWFSYTTFFIIRDGWHWRAVDPVEKVLDQITYWGWSIGFDIWVLIVALIIHKAIKDTK